MPATINFQKCHFYKCLFGLLLLLMVLSIWIKYPNMKYLIIDWAYKEVKHGEGTFYICPLFMGRLGNNMFQYATAYGIATEKDLRVIIPNVSLIAKTFNVDADMPENPTRICSTFPVFSEPNSAWAIHIRSFQFGIYGNYSVCIRGYFQSYKYFNSVKTAIKKQFMSFKEDTRIKATTILQEARRYYLANLNASNVTLVGVHVRRGDKLARSETQQGQTVAPREYFVKAMDYFNSNDYTREPVKLHAAQPGSIRMIISGLSGSGKTQLIFNSITRWMKWNTLYFIALSVDDQQCYEMLKDFKEKVKSKIDEHY